MFTRVSSSFRFNFANPLQKGAVAGAHQVAKSCMLFWENETNKGNDFSRKK